MYHFIDFKRPLKHGQGKHENPTLQKYAEWWLCDASLTMCGICCMCAVMFTLDGPRVLGSSCLATVVAVGWTVTKDRTPDRGHEKTRDEQSA